MQDGSASNLATSTRRSLELLCGHRSLTLLWIPSAMNESAANAIGPLAKPHRMLVITVACLYCLVVPRSWQVFHLDDLDVGVMTVALTVTIVGCLVTVVRRLQGTTRALR